MTSGEKDLLEKLVADCAKQIMEHADSVRIFVTRHDEGEEKTTIDHTRGMGNFYAQRGQVDAWLEETREQERHEARRRIERDGDGDD